MSTPRPNAQGPLNHHWGGDAVSYFAVHRRLRVSRGPARSHPCAECGVTARQWSYTYDPGEPWKRMPFSTDLSRYRPLCGPCHKIYDNARPGRPVQRGAVPLSDRETALARIAAGETQTTVAASLGVTQAAVSRWVVQRRNRED